MKFVIEPHAVGDGFYCHQVDELCDFYTSGHGKTELEALDDYLCHVQVHGRTQRTSEDFDFMPTRPTCDELEAGYSTETYSATTDPTTDPTTTTVSDGDNTVTETRPTVETLAMEILSGYIERVEVKRMTQHDQVSVKEISNIGLEYASLARRMALRLMGQDNDTVPLGVPVSMMG